MNAFLTAAVALSFAAQAGAATLHIDNTTTTPPGTGNFGRTAGAYVLFSSTGLDSTANLNWGSAPPQDGQPYSIDSVSFVKNNVGPATSPENLWVGVYTGYAGGTLTGFLGASNASVAWAAATSGSTQTWSFDGISVTANSGVQLYFMFQTSAEARTTQLGLSAENDISTRRLTDNGTTNGGAHTYAAQGAGIIQDNGDVRDTRIPFITLQTTLIPEPSSAALFGLGALALLRRRR